MVGSDEYRECILTSSCKLTICGGHGMRNIHLHHGLRGCQREDRQGE